MTKDSSSSRQVGGASASLLQRQHRSKKRVKRGLCAETSSRAIVVDSRISQRKGRCEHRDNGGAQRCSSLCQSERFPFGLCKRKGTLSKARDREIDGCDKLTCFPYSISAIMAPSLAEPRLCQYIEAAVGSEDDEEARE